MRFEDGVTSPNAGHPDPRMIMDPLPRGWYLWVCTNDNEAFERWMEENCPTADVDLKFNGGNPRYLIFIENEAEAVSFVLRWL
jgi:hypothetical protein